MHSVVASSSVPTLSSKNDAPVLHATPDEDETCVIEHHDHQPASPDTTMHSADDIIHAPVTQLMPVDERFDSTSSAEPVDVLPASNTRQNVVDGEPIVPASGGAVKKEAFRYGSKRRSYGFRRRIFVIIIRIVSG